jgi:hypothetical protein
VSGAEPGAFAPDWLDLREPADRRARDRRLLAAAAAWLRAEPGSAAVDLGAGTGATMRAFAGRAPGTRWRLVDRDAGLLAEAERRCGGGVAAIRADLADVAGLPLGDARLVTASALLDLASEAWLATLADRLASAAAGFYVALTYDGAMRWRPADAADGAVLAAFNRDQRRNKGLGPALGPEAAPRLAAALRARGYRVETAPSPWRLPPGALQARLVVGVAAAAAAAGEPAAAAWGRRRAASDACCDVGHWDLLALPATAPATSA